MGDLWKEFVDPADIAYQALRTLPSGDSNPDSFGAAFSGDSENGAYGTGFGPGDYSGGYTGEGDTIYWGAWDPPEAAGTAWRRLQPGSFQPRHGGDKGGRRREPGERRHPAKISCRPGGGA